MGKNKRGAKKQQQASEEAKQETISAKPLLAAAAANTDWMSVLTQKMQEDEEQKSYGKELLV